MNQRAARHPPCRCFALQPSAGYAACLDCNTGCRNFLAHELNTVKMYSQHDFSPPVVTESHRACYAIHLDDSVCPLIFHIAEVSRAPSHIHVRVTLVIWWLFPFCRCRWTLAPSGTWLEHRERGSPPRRWCLVDRAYDPAEGRGSGKSDSFGHDGLETGGRGSGGQGVKWCGSCPRTRI